MSKRRLDEADDRAVNKYRKGFTVGPDNLPDGQHKRKAQQIKRNLIEKAKLKKEYAKVQAQQSQAASVASTTMPFVSQEEPTNEPHPDRRTLIERTHKGEFNNEDVEKLEEGTFRRRARQPKSIPFAREHRQALQDKEEAEERRRAREEAERQRQQKLQERDRFRKAMTKARTPGADGRRKLGRESKILLDKVKRLMD